MYNCISCAFFKYEYASDTTPYNKTSGALLDTKVVVLVLPDPLPKRSGVSEYHNSTVYARFGAGATINVFESQLAQYLGSPVKLVFAVDLSTAYSSMNVVSTCSNHTISPSDLCSCKPLANLKPPSGPETSKKELLA